MARKAANTGLGSQFGMKKESTWGTAVTVDTFYKYESESLSLDQTYVPVRFHSKVTELGVFELWCVSTQGDQRWKLEFSVREEE